MKKNPLFWAAVVSAACLLLSAGASLLFNEGRLVYPTDLSAYRFRPADLPMLLYTFLESYDFSGKTISPS